jgi:hypothetical protein
MDPVKCAMDTRRACSPAPLDAEHCGSGADGKSPGTCAAAMAAVSTKAQTRPGSAIKSGLGWRMGIK